MTDLLNDLSRDTILSLVGLIFGIIGIVLAIIFYLKSKKNKTPYYLIKSFNIISESLGNKIKDIEILLKGEKISNLTVSKIVLWNGGNETINRIDIPDSTKFKIRTKEMIKIYDIEIIDNSDSAINCSIISVPNEHILDFDFLDPNQGFIIKVTHSGINSDDLIISGRVKGGFSLFNKITFNETQLQANEILNKVIPPSDVLIKKRGLKYIMLFLGLACIISSLTITDSSIFFRIVIGVFGAFNFFGGIVAIAEKGVPKNISKRFEED